MTARLHFTCSLLGLLCATACASSDGASPEAADPSSTSDQTAPISRTTAAVPAGDPAPLCDRFDLRACASGQECRVAIRKSPQAAEFGVYSTCVAGVPGLRPDAACEPWGGRMQRYDVPGVTDSIYVDPCDFGLVCTQGLLQSGAYSCRPHCEFGLDQLCVRGQVCYSGAPTSFEEACIEADACDPTLRDQCGPGNECYVRPNDMASGILTVCLKQVAGVPLEDGAACQSSLDCKPGSWCWGPAASRPSSISEDQLRCRKLCTLPSGVSQACPAGATCQDLSGAKAALTFSEVPVDLGQCE
jgi:hypothetical protein